MNKTATAFSPSGISSFFEICDREANGTPIKDLARIGARGGGFAFEKGVLTNVTVEDSEKTSIEIYINGCLAPKALTTRRVVEELLKYYGNPCKVLVRHEVRVPIGAGFGTSAAGALTATLALNEALNLNLTYNSLAMAAHKAEIECKTGLGTVVPLTVGGFILTVEPGGPGYALIDRIPISPDYRLIVGFYGSIYTKEVLTDEKKREAVNAWGNITLKRILEEPSLENFLKHCREFARKTGFATRKVEELFKLADEAGAVGAAQNMIGEAVHAVAYKEDVERVVEAFNRVLPKEKILAGKIEWQGARLVGNTE